MVTQLPAKQTVGSRLGSALGQGAQIGIQQGIQQAQQQNQQQQQSVMLNEALTQAQQIYANPNLSPEQKQIGLYQALAHRPEIAQQLNNQYIESQKAQAQNVNAQANQVKANRPVAPKAPAGGLSGQPVPPEVSSKIEEIIDDSKDLNADQLAVKLDKAHIPRAYSNSYIESRRRKDDQSSKRHADASDKILDENEKTRASLIKKDQALALQDDAVAKKDLSFFSRDNLADITGIEGFRSTEGAIYKAAGKEYFLGSISKAGARPNQWIEQQIMDMMGQVGRSTEANLSVNRALRNELDLEKEQVRLTDDLSQKLEKELGYVPRNIGQMVQKELTIYAENKQKELFNDLRAIKSIGENSTQKFMSVAPGTPVSKFVAQALLNKFDNDPQKAEAEAKRLGYIF